MEATEFVDAVRRRANLDSDEAARAATTATVRTLGERIGDSQVSELAAELPESVAEPLVDAGGGPAADFSFDEFVARVRDRAGIDESDVLVRVRAVIATLREAAGKELADAREQLPGEFDLVFETGAAVSGAAFVDAVARRTSLDSDEAARAAVTATLTTLGERISRGEAAKLATYLPAEFGAAVTDRPGEAAATFSVDEFVARVADREGIDDDVAADHARAVVATLAEVVSGRELEHVRSQLPDEFAPLFERVDEGDGEA